VHEALDQPGRGDPVDVGPRARAPGAAGRRPRGAPGAPAATRPAPRGAPRPPAGRRPGPEAPATPGHRVPERLPLRAERTPQVVDARDPVELPLELGQRRLERLGRPPPGPLPVALRARGPGRPPRASGPRPPCMPAR